MLPYKVNNYGTLIMDALLPKKNAWINHDGYLQKFPGQTILHIHHTTIGNSIPEKMLNF